MKYDNKILSEILSIKNNWTISDVYHIHDSDKDRIGMDVIYYEKSSEYSILRFGFYQLMREEYFNHIRNKKLKKITENI